MSEAVVITICWDCRRARALSRLRRCQACLDAMSKSNEPYLPGERYDPHGPETYKLLDRPEAPVVPLHMHNVNFPWKGTTETDHDKVRQQMKKIEEDSKKIQHQLDTNPKAWDALAEMIRGKKKLLDYATAPIKPPGI